MGFRSRKTKFYQQVDQDFKNRIENIFPLITDDHIPSFSYIVTWEIVRDNPYKPWDWSVLSGNANITWENVRDNPHLPWNWFWISRNPKVATW